MREHTKPSKLAMTVVAIAVLALAYDRATATAVATAVRHDWSVDPAHTQVAFSVDHFFTPVRGEFDDFEVSLSYDRKDPGNSRVTARIPVASIDTGNDKRDAHLRSGDWFEADKHPYLTFESKAVRRLAENRLLATGTLTIKGHSREIALPIEVLGVHQVPEAMQGMMMGVKEVASFRAALSIDRNDYDVGTGSWAGTTVVGDTVSIDLLVEANHQ